MTGFPILTVLTFFPIVGAIVLLFIDKENYPVLRVATLIFSLVEFALSLHRHFRHDEVTTVALDLFV